MQNAKCRMQNAECKMQNANCKIRNAKWGRRAAPMQNVECEIKDEESIVWRGLAPAIIIRS